MKYKKSQRWVNNTWTDIPFEDIKTGDKVKLTDADGSVQLSLATGDAMPYGEPGNYCFQARHLDEPGPGKEITNED